MDKLLMFLGVFLFVYFLYLISIIWKEKKNNNFSDSGQASLIIEKYRLNKKKLNHKKFSLTIAFWNSVILALTFTICDFVESMFLKLLLAFIILIPLILGCYHMIGRKYQRKEKEGD